jgi:hypothetical protein
VEKTDKNGVLVRVHNTVRVGDMIEIILPLYDIISVRVKDMVDSKSKEHIIEAHGGGGGQMIYLPNMSGKKILPYTVIRRKIKIFL